MKALFDKEVANEVILRIEKLKSSDVPQWGKMNVAQMLAHLQAPVMVGLGELKIKRSLVGILFGRLIKKKLFNEEPFSHGLPTAKEFVRADQRDFEEERKKLLTLIKRIVDSAPDGITKDPHPFFGRLTVQEWSESLWKHHDHHLRQFGV